MFHARHWHTTARMRDDRDEPLLSASIRRTDSGVRIKFSDGRLSWIDKADQTDNDFMDEVLQWARLHGAETTLIEHP